MSTIVEKLAANGHLSEEQVERIGTRVHAFMDELKRDPELMEKAAGFLESLAPAAKTLGVGALFGTGAAAAGYGAQAAAGAIEDYRHSLGKAKHYKEMLEANPELSSGNIDATMVQRHFNTLHKFNPDYASDPVVAGTYVQNAIDMSRPNIEAINNLVNARKNISQSRGPGALPGAFAAGVGEATSQFGKTSA